MYGHEQVCEAVRHQDMQPCDDKGKEEDDCKHVNTDANDTGLNF